MNTNEDKPLNLATVSAMMNLCETIEQEKKGAANAILEPEQKREAYRTRLREFYAREGVTISPESIEQAVDAQLENEAAFQPPPKNLGWWAARMFVYRLPLAFGLVTVMMVTALALAISHAVQVKGQQDACHVVASLVAQNQRSLQDVTEAVRKAHASATASQQRRAAQWADGTLSTIIKVPQTDLQNRIDTQLAEADRLVQKAGAFVTQEQDLLAKGAVPWKRHSAGGWQALGVRARQEADQCRWPDLNQLVQTVDAVLAEQNKLDTAARSWALLVGNSRLLEPSSRWHQDVQQKLDTAKGYLQAGQSAEAGAAISAAQQLLGDWHNWQQAQENLQKAIAAAKLCLAKNEAARTALAQGLSQAQQAAAQQNAQASQQALQKLQEVTGQLNSQYTIQIVCRNGQRTVVERTHDQSGGKRWYLIVEAINDRGQALPQTIKNRETGEVVTARLWGEEIPQELYAKIYNEKKNTGAIEDLSFGRKEAGYLDPHYTRIDRSTHRITSW